MPSSSSVRRAKLSACWAPRPRIASCRRRSDRFIVFRPAIEVKRAYPKRAPAVKGWRRAVLRLGQIVPFGPLAKSDSVAEPRGTSLAQIDSTVKEIDPCWFSSC
ncbi:hypothetical protein NITMOv2_3242 [Nitrospira moscoviensis]|uniref:Uncharacterized protein n=1 Tax=Nitrospira moscoviensis TaxID=42253 RepID=A0A0K2GG82_NITMO|nr:hypothetical protein NITMOv2_3242 [Nitrospira moscoviensis]